MLVGSSRSRCHGRPLAPDEIYPAASAAEAPKKIAILLKFNRIAIAFLINNYYLVVAKKNRKISVTSNGKGSL